VTWLVVGLGNPGPTYASTRHNIGYMVADALALRMGGTAKNLGWKKHKSGRADIVEGRLAGERVVLGRARTYMNESGGPVSTLTKFFDVQADRLIVVHDELDLDFGRLRVKLGGGDNGHNGLRSIRQSIATGDFYRVRCGIGRPPGRQTVEDYVLKPYSSVERKDLPVTIEVAADAVERLVSTDLATTQQDFNS